MNGGGGLLRIPVIRLEALFRGSLSKALFGRPGRCRTGSGPFDIREALNIQKILYIHSGEDSLRRHVHIIFLRGSVGFPFIFGNNKFKGKS